VSIQEKPLIYYNPDTRSWIASVSSTCPQPEVTLPHLTPETFWFSKQKGAAIGIWWVEARCVTEHSAIHRMGHRRT
jgi:hypothetical protein